MRDRILTWLANLVWRRPAGIIIIALALAGLSIAYAATSLKLNANLDDLIAPDRPYMREYRAFLNEFGDLEFMLVVVENNGDEQQTQAAVDVLTIRLRQIQELPGVYSAITEDEQLRIATRAMSDEELADFSLVARAFPSLLSNEGTSRVLRDANDLLNQLLRSGATMQDDEQQRLGAAAIFLLNLIASSQDESLLGEQRPQRDALLASNVQPQYFKSDTGRFYYILVMPVKDYGTLAVIEEPLRKIRAAIEEVRKQFPTVDIGLTGKPVLQADEMATSNDDMTKASILAFVLCAILFVLMIGGILRPLLAMFAFLIGSAWTYGAVTLVLGQLNLLSIVFMLVLVGVALDYGVHIISRYKEERRRLDVRQSILIAMQTAARGNITGALTSSTVFFMALFTTFRGLRELGVVAGMGLLLCLVAITLVLPALLAIVDRRRSQHAHEHQAGSKPTNAESSAIVGFSAAQPNAILILVVLISLALIAWPGRLQFEHNLLKLHARGLESVEWEHRILEDSASATWFGAVVVDTQEEALSAIDNAIKQPTIGAIHSVFDVIQPQTSERDALRRQLHEALDASSQTIAATQTHSSTQWTIADLRRAVASLDLIAVGAIAQAQTEATQLRQLSDRLKEIIHALESGATLTNEVIDQHIARAAHSLQLVLERDRLSLREALPNALRQQYLSPEPNSRYLIALHPKENVWEYDSMRAFIEDMREVHPHVTGVPITHFESLHEMLRSFLIMSLLAIVVITIIVWLDFRRMRDVALALAPLLLSLAWTTELMGIFGVSFNLANFFAVPILIGLGVDASVHILHRYHEGGPTRFSLGGTRRAVILTGLTTIIGFGCLLIAHHRGLRSLGMVMTIGSACSMIASIVVLPALLAWLEQRTSKRRSVETSNSASSR